jgi:outer membrane receptor protein involved in Fe transport
MKKIPMSNPLWAGTGLVPAIISWLVTSLFAAGGATAPNGGALPGYQQVNLSIVRPIDTGLYRALEFRFDVINLLDQVYRIRSGTGLGVFAPQFGPRRTFLAGLTQHF